MTRNEAEAKVERLLDDLGWLVSDSGIELDGFQRDAVGHLRCDLEGWLSGETFDG